METKLPLRHKEGQEQKMEKRCYENSPATQPYHIHKSRGTQERKPPRPPAPDDEAIRLAARTKTGLVTRIKSPLRDIPALRSLADGERDGRTYPPKRGRGSVSRRRLPVSFQESALAGPQGCPGSRTSKYGFSTETLGRVTWLSVRALEVAACQEQFLQMLQFRGSQEHKRPWPSLGRTEASLQGLLAPRSQAEGEGEAGARPSLSWKTTGRPAKAFGFRSLPLRPRPQDKQKASEPFPRKAPSPFVLGPEAGHRPSGGLN
ncbi:uncharacterized protein LOC123386240 [Felis catus]|uniref:uncharacterized protein LOC123386240 n=1 Tax=Felis catus TaxID=9685 RepID=UPI001D19DB37|nr:uncharacterized protein LOC123386240 [Felis catus]